MGLHGAASRPQNERSTRRLAVPSGVDDLAAVFGPFVLCDTVGRWRGNVFISLKESRCFVAVGDLPCNRAADECRVFYRMESAIVYLRHWTAALVISAALLSAGCKSCGHRAPCATASAAPPCGCNGTAAPVPVGGLPAGAIPVQGAPVPGQSFQQ
jgi:hypothetical protein